MSKHSRIPNGPCVQTSTRAQGLIPIAKVQGAVLIRDLSGLSRPDRSVPAGSTVRFPSAHRSSCHKPYRLLRTIRRTNRPPISSQRQKESARTTGLGPVSFPPPLRTRGSHHRGRFGSTTSPPSENSLPAGSAIRKLRDDQASAYFHLCILAPLPHLNGHLTDSQSNRPFISTCWESSYCVIQTSDTRITIWRNRYYATQE